MGYDVIGDVHGHADALKELLLAMGYSDVSGHWRHPDRKAVFVGDFIDRGPNQIETVDLVRAMVDAGSALAVMGNHELNAIGWMLFHDGEYLRVHSEKNGDQHKAFLAEVDGTPKHQEILTWFMTLPLWLELDGIRVTHACWHVEHMDYLRPYLIDGNKLSPQILVDVFRDEVSNEDHINLSIFSAVESILKGIEVRLPEGSSFVDKDGHTRQHVRTRWWDPNATTFELAALIDDVSRRSLPKAEIPLHMQIGYKSEKPLFIGHYWQSGKPEILTEKVACVDYSIGKGSERGGKLVAYRWDGETKLSSDKFFYI